MNIKCLLILLSRRMCVYDLVFFFMGIQSKKKTMTRTHARLPRQFKTVECYWVICIYGLKKISRFVSEE